MKPEERSVEVIEKLGVAGGEKYLHGPQRIFFKLCVDSHNLYGGDEGASKAAGNELKGIMEYMDCRLAGLRFPMTVVIDYLGYRLVAESVLPIDRVHTLVYGSSDGGRTIVSQDEHVSKLMKRAAQRLNLTHHLMWDGARQQLHALSSCVDIEVHRGQDGRLYLIDAARAMPPTTPVPMLRGCNLYRLFRPEFVAKYPKPLCPDAYGGWPLENRQQYEADVDEATQTLLNEACPKFAATLDENPTQEDLDTMAHRAGINMRLLGVCLGSSRNPLSRMLLISEVVSRTIKNVLRHRMRAIRTDNAEAYHNVAIDCINAFLVGHDPAYWGREFKRSMVKRFPGTLTRDQVEDPELDVRMWCSPSLVLKRVCTLVSLSLTTRAQLRVLRLFYPTLKDVSNLDAVLHTLPEQAWGPWKAIPHGDRQSVRLMPEDISSLTPRVKTLHVLEFEEGTALAKHAQDDADFQRAESRYRASIMIRPSDLRALHNWGISCTLHAVSLLNNRPDDKRAQGASGDMETDAIVLFRRAVAKYRTCISINSQDWVAMYLWGNTLLSWFGSTLRSQQRPCSPELLHRARERYESAWVACVGTSPDTKEVSFTQLAAGTSGARVRELLYAWGNTYLLEAMHCESADWEKLLRAAVIKYREAISMSEDDHSGGAHITIHSLDYRLLYNLSVALARLIGKGEHNLAQAVSALKQLTQKLQDPVPSTVFFHWASIVTRHIRQTWGSLGLGRDKRHDLERTVLEGLHRWTEALDACLVQDDSQLAATLDGWGQLLFLWSEIRFKMYGTHHSIERIATSAPGTPRFQQHKRSSVFSQLHLQARASSAVVMHHDVNAKQTNSQTSDWSVSAEEISEDAGNADPLQSESEEDAPESSESDDETPSDDVSVAPVSEDVYLYCVDLFLYTFVTCYKNRPTARPKLTSLVPLGAAKDFTLSTHTITALLSLASEASDLATRQECERTLQSIKATGGNHKLNFDAEVDMFLPQTVRQCVAEAVRGQYGSGSQAVEGPFGAERAHLRSSNMDGSLTIVEDLEYEGLWHGETVT